MLNINHILVVLDKGSNELHALKKGIWMARSVNAELTLLTNTWDSYSADNTTLDEDTRYNLKEGLISQTRKWLNSFIHDVEDIKVNVDVRWQKHLYEAVLEATRETNYDLVLKRPNKHSLMDRIFTPVDWNLLRHCPAPIMLIKSSEPWKHSRILASIDATSADEGHQLINDNILSFAEQLSDHFETDMHLVNAYPLVNVAFAMVPEVTAPDDLHQYVQEQHEEACGAWADKYNISRDKIHVSEGAPEIVVSDLAKSLAVDVVMIGSVGRTGLSGVLIGNTAELLLDKVECDILVIKQTDGVNPDA